TTGDTWASQETIARAMRLTVKTVYRSCSKMQKLGYLKIRFDGHFGTNRMAPNFEKTTDQRSPIEANRGVRSGRTDESENTLQLSPSTKSLQRSGSKI